jgi:uncharacterized protein
MKINIKKVPRKGRGVFASQNLQPGELIEVCELLIMDHSEAGPALEGYVYEYDKRRVALALGNGSLYNHADIPNAEYLFNKKSRLLYIRAVKPILSGQEITIDYGYHMDDRKRFGIN